MSNNKAISQQVDKVDMKLLQQIHEHYIELAESRGVKLPKFGEPRLNENELLIAFLQYLKDILWIISEGDCRNPCPDGTCPPCEPWTRQQYDEYISSFTNP